MRKAFGYLMGHSLPAVVILGILGCMGPLNTQNFLDSTALRSVVPGGFINTASEGGINGNAGGVTGGLGGSFDATAANASRALRSADAQAANITTADSILIYLSRVTENLDDILVASAGLASLSVGSDCTNYYAGSSGFGTLIGIDVQNIVSILSAFATTAPAGWTLQSTPDSIPGTSSQYAYTYQNDVTGAKYSVALNGSPSTGKWVFGYDASSSIPITDGATISTFTTNKGIFYADLSTNTMQFAFRIIGTQTDSSGDFLQINVSPIVTYTPSGASTGVYSLDMIGGVIYNGDPYMAQGTFALNMSASVLDFSFNAIFPDLSGDIRASYNGSVCSMTKNTLIN